jgi:hypothetical protein
MKDLRQSLSEVNWRNIAFELGGFFLIFVLFLLALGAFQ